MARRVTRGSSPETLLRQWNMLLAIPRGQKIGTADIESRLSQQGFDVDRRTIQRDLLKLREVLPLEVDSNHKPHGWGWAKDAPVMQIPGMDMHTALTFSLAEDYLRRALPRSTLQRLEPHFKYARQVLSQSDKKRYASWPEKIRILSRGLMLQPPKVEPRVLDAVYEALLEERRLRVQYRKRGEKQAKPMEVHPLGILYRDAVGYLVCTVSEYTDVRQLVLNRMSAAELTSLPRNVPDGFDLDKVARGGTFIGPWSEKPLRLKLKFNTKAAVHLYETPLSDDQKITELDGDHFRLEATVTDTMELQWWLLGFGEYVEVLAPDRYRKKFADTARNLAKIYSH
jgi:predicted DNA-binding transcriptional regulator YafY